MEKNIAKNRNFAFQKANRKYAKDDLIVQHSVSLSSSNEENAVLQEPVLRDSQALADVGRQPSQDSEGPTSSK